MTQDLASYSAAMNEAGLAVGLGLDPATSRRVPVVSAANGTFARIDGGILDQDNGAALGINARGDILGSAGIGTQSGPGPGPKAWVLLDGTRHDL